METKDLQEGLGMYAIDVDFFLRLNEFEQLTGDSSILELPYSMELDKAVLLINKLVSDKLATIKKQRLEENLLKLYKFCITSQGSTREYIESGMLNLIDEIQKCR